MSVETEATRIKVTAGNDVLVDFDFAFKIFAKTDLTCYKVSAAGVYTLGVLDGGGATGYTVVFDTDEETGTVSWATAPVTSGFSVVIGDAIPDTQTTNFPREGVTSAVTQKNAYDKLTLMIQQLVERVSRTLLQPLTPVNPDPISVDAPVDRRGLVFEDNGDGTWKIVSTDDDPDTALAAALAAQVAAEAAQVAAETAETNAETAETNAETAETNAAASAVAAAASAVIAVATITELTGTQAARPAAPPDATKVAFYWATDSALSSRWSPTGARWIEEG